MKSKTTNVPRRQFLIGTASLLTFETARAQSAAPEMVKDTDAAAIAIGYSSDGSKTDIKKYPQYKPNQSCTGCVLFSGTATAASAGCAVFGNKSVSAKGWCSAWSKKG